MKFGLFDISFVVLYLLLLVTIGVLMRKRASKNISTFLLAGKKFPWYILGVSNASGMFDIFGAMVLVILAFTLGLNSILIPGIIQVFSQVFVMVFLAMWIRRSNAATGAEWMTTRFGNGKESHLLNGVVVTFVLISCIGFLSFGFIGIGKLVELFIPWDFVSLYLPFEMSKAYLPHIYGIVFSVFAVFYSLMGGMPAIVWSDVIHYLVITVSAILIGLIAMDALISYPLVKPDGWYGPVSSLKHNIDQTRILDDLNLRISSDGYSLFSVFFMMFLFKGIMVSFAGPAMNSDMQKILSSKSPGEAAKMSGFASLIILPSRFFMIAGLAVLGLIYTEQHYMVGAEKIGLEKVLPSIINEFIPAGFLGILIVGLLGTFISAFAGTINVAQAYLVNDIYLKYKNPKPSDKKINQFFWVSGLVVVAISIIVGFFVKNSNSLMIWILSALYGSFVVSNSLRWYWWRFNSKGYIWGMISGIVPALLLPFILPGILNIYYFPIILCISLIGSVTGTLMNPPTNSETLKAFYKTVRPWGGWKPVYNLIKTENPGFKKNNTISRDVLNIVVGIIAQTSLLLIPVYVVLMNILPLFITLLIFGVCLFILKMTWWNNLETEKKKYEQHVQYDMNLKQVDLG